MSEKDPSKEDAHTEIERLLSFFRGQRYDCLDDLPEKAVHTLGDSKYYLYKCRTVWWQGIISAFKYLLEFTGIIDDEDIRKQMEGFLDFTETIQWRNFRSREEINKANAIIETVIVFLESK